MLNSLYGKGSPPRMRGKLFFVFGFIFRKRITPADAGKTKKGVLSLGETRITPADAGKTNTIPFRIPSAMDHPRGCGENYLLLFQSRQHTGSPPRMRGKLFAE